MNAPFPQLGRYQILSELGRGAMGVVYKAQDPALDRTVAVKTILLSSDPEERRSYEARFLQEARAAGRLNHPAIITIYDVGREGDLAYMAMELLQGIDLRERLSREGLTLRAAVDLAIQIADGLAFAHGQGVVHRDIKPANVMILPGERVKIMDFGLARLNLSDVKTQTGVLLGTPKYMSPEQVAGGVVDARSDLFALGTVLYEMLVGRPPFTGADTAQLLHRIASMPHAAPSRIVSNLPPVLDLIVARALQKDPASRYQNASEFSADLQACRSDLSSMEAARTAAEHEVSNASDAEATQKLSAVKIEHTQKLLAADMGASMSRQSASMASAVSFWPLARGFDYAPALLRLEQPSAEDSLQLTQAPRPLPAWRRHWSDPAARRAALVLGLGFFAGLLLAVI